MRGAGQSGSRLTVPLANHHAVALDLTIGRALASSFIDIDSAAAAISLPAAARIVLLTVVVIAAAPDVVPLEMATITMTMAMMVVLAMPLAAIPSIMMTVFAVVLTVVVMTPMTIVGSIHSSADINRADNWRVDHCDRFVDCLVDGHSLVAICERACAD